MRNTGHEDCREHLAVGELGDATTVWDAMRQAGMHFDRSRDRRWFAGAAHVGAAAFKPVPGHNQPGGAGLWCSPEREAVVDAAVFSPLVQADATRIWPGERLVVGRLVPGAAEPREVVRFLLRAELVGTYRHLSSELCWRDEERTESGYRACFSGTHLYYTTSRNIDPLAFEVHIGTDGLIEVVGGDVGPSA